MPFLPSATTLARSLAPHLGALYTSALPLLNVLSQPPADATASMRRSPSRYPAGAGASPSDAAPGPGFADLNLTSLAVLALTLVIGVKVLGVLRRAVWGWLVLLLRLGFWSAVVGGAALIWGRGGEAVLDDARGLGEALWRWWLGEGQQMVWGWMDGARMAAQGRR